MESGVFITDGHWRKSLAAVRALGTHGIPVCVGETTWLATAGFSRYCSRRVVYPSPLMAADAFADFIMEDLQRHPQRMLLAMEDPTLELASRYRKRISRLVFNPVVSWQQLQTAQRKDKVLQLAQKLGVPTPRTWFIHRLEQIQSLKATLPYPVAIKPRQGSGAVGLAFAHNAEQMVRAYHRIHKRFPLPLIQERIPARGPGLGASFLIDEKGAPMATFMHQRLREYPVGGGASTLRKSIWRDDLREMGLALLKALNWFGVAMVEFKLDPRDNTPKLMEINPRFWGSLALAVHAGVNFPHLLYRMACGERITPKEKYKLGVQCRWLLHGDILHYIHARRRHRLSPPFFRVRRPGLHYDILSRHDPWPAVARLLMPLTLLYDQDMKWRLKQRQTAGS